MHATTYIRTYIYAYKRNDFTRILQIDFYNINIGYIACRDGSGFQCNSIGYMMAIPM